MCPSQVSTPSARRPSGPHHRPSPPWARHRLTSHGRSMPLSTWSTVKILLIPFTNIPAGRPDSPPPPVLAYFQKEVERSVKGLDPSVRSLNCTSTTNTGRAWFTPRLSLQDLLITIHYPSPPQGPARNPSIQSAPPRPSPHSARMCRTHGQLRRPRRPASVHQERNEVPTDQQPPASGGRLLIGEHGPLFENQCQRTCYLGTTC